VVKAAALGGSRDSDHRVGGTPDWSWTFYPPQVAFWNPHSTSVVGHTGSRYHGIVTGPAVSEELIVSTYACAGRATGIGFQHQDHARIDEWASLVSNVHPGASVSPNHLMRQPVIAHAGSILVLRGLRLKDAGCRSWLHVLCNPEKAR